MFIGLCQEAKRKLNNRFKNAGEKMTKKFYFLPNLNEKILKKMTEEDRKFAMMQLDHHIETILNMQKFRLTFSISYAAIYFAIIAMIISINGRGIYLIITTAFFLFLFFMFCSIEK
mgnify:CR=1 FL=1